jgi:signal transduction histidine kinase
MIRLEIALVAGAALIQLGGTALAAQHQTGYGTFGVAGIALLALGVAALPFRRRFPVGVLAVTVATTLTYWSLGYPRGPVFAAMVIAFVYVVLTGRRIGALVGLAAWLATLFSVSELVRNRRERARDAERSRAEIAQRRAADERLRIAQELHDVIAHSMSLINLRAGVALHLIDNDPEQARDALATIKEVSKEGLVELRSVLGVLRQGEDAAPRSPAPTLRRLDELLERARASGVDVRLETEGDLHTLPRNVDLAAYRIVQESLTNVARHSTRPDAVVRLQRGDGMLDIGIVDGGTPPAVGPIVAGEGHGIVGMRERAASVGGDLTAGPCAGGGFEVRANLPLGEPA